MLSDISILFFFVVNEMHVILFPQCILFTACCVSHPREAVTLFTCVTYHSQRKALVANYGSANPPTKK